MNKSDLPVFIRELGDAHKLKGVPPHDDGALALFFRLMEPYPIETVVGAIRALLVDPDGGQYRTPITPAHLHGQIEKVMRQDGRPEPDEAWSIALESMDEAATVVVTPEMLAALVPARKLLEHGDKISARKAFISAYEREVKAARERRIMPQWRVSLGSDPDRRVQALESPRVQALLPPAAVAALLGRPEAEPEYDPEEARQNIHRIQGMLAAAIDKRARQTQHDRDRHQRLLAEHDAKLQQHTGGEHDG